MLLLLWFLAAALGGSAVAESLHSGLNVQQVLDYNPAIEDWNYTNDVLTVDWITLEPGEPHLAMLFNLTIRGDLSEDLTTDATVFVSMWVNETAGKTEGRMKLCEVPSLRRIEQKGREVECPPKKGEVEVEFRDWPWFLKPGELLHVQFEAKTHKNETITCLQAELPIADH